MCLADSLTLLAHFFTEITKKDVRSKPSIPQTLTIGAAKPREKVGVNLYHVSYFT